MEHVTLDLRVTSSSPTLGVEPISGEKKIVLAQRILNLPIYSADSQAPLDYRLLLDC